MVTMHRDSDMVRIKNKKHIRAAMYINNKREECGAPGCCIKAAGSTSPKKEKGKKTRSGRCDIQVSDHPFAFESGWYLVLMAPPQHLAWTHLS